MESGRKRRVSKGKFISFYRAPKPSVQYANKIIPTPTTPTASLGYLVQDFHAMARSQWLSTEVPNSFLSLCPIDPSKYALLM